MKRSVIVVVVLAACAPQGSSLSTRTPPSRTSTPASPAPIASPQPSTRQTPTPDLRWRASTAAPSTLIVNRAGRIEVRRIDGRLVRTLADRSETGRLPSWLSFALSPDRRTLYFLRYRTENCSEVVSVPVAGGPIRFVARGNSLSLSTDGTRLAYADSWNCGSRRSQAVVRDLGTGTEGAWVDKRGFGGSVAWMPEGRFLNFEECGADSCGPRLIDSRTMRVTDRNAYSLPAFVDQMNVFVRGPVLRGDTGSVVLQVSYSSEDGTEPHPILEYNTRTRETRSLFEIGRNIRALDFDASGDHLLYSTRDNRLFHYQGSRAVRITDGVMHAVW